MKRSPEGRYRWAFYVAAGFLYAGAILRSPLVIDRGDVLVAALLLLFASAATLLAEAVLSRRGRPWFAVYLAVQSALVVALLALPGSHDFFAVLFGVLSMQAMDRYGARLGTLCIALFVPLTALPLLTGPNPSEVAVFVFLYTALDILLGVYTLTTKQASEARSANQVLAAQLQAANTDLRAYASRAERLAVARERNRVARELHDSVTQTIFSMNLTSQSAILLEGRPEQVRGQLDRLAQLTQTALGEMHALILELAPHAGVEDGLVQAIRRDVERRSGDGLQVAFEVDQPPVASGAGLRPEEEQGLLRIAQEALNNVAKHSGASTAAVTLRLWEPPRMEIEDHGKGFRPQENEAAGMGLASMAERAAEIGWRLAVESEPGRGTRVVVEKPLAEGSDV